MSTGWSDGAAPHDRVGGPVIGVISSKGGAGTTMVAANLAQVIAGEAGSRVALVELDVRAGQLHRLFRLTEPPLLAVLEGEATLTPEVLERQVSPRPGQVSVIAAPSHPPESREIGSGRATDLVQGLAGVSDAVVVDLGHRVGPAEAAVIRRADAVLLVVALTDLGVHSSLGLMATLAKRGVTRVIPVLNRTEANSEIDAAPLRGALGGEESVHLPYDPVVVASCMNRGTLFVREHPAAQVSRKLRSVAARLVTMPEPATAGQGTDRTPARAAPPRARGGGGHLFGLLDRGT